MDIRPACPDDDPADYRVAVLDGEIVGYVSLHQAVPLPSHQHVLTINGLAVTPSARGRGVGRALVTGMLDEATGRGATKVSLRVLSGNTAEVVVAGHPHGRRAHGTPPVTERTGPCVGHGSEPTRWRRTVPCSRERRNARTAA